MNITGFATAPYAALPSPSQPPTRIESGHRCSDACADTLPAPVDYERTYETHWQNREAVDDRFLDFSRALTPRLQTMHTLRPGVMAQAFDTVLDRGRLKVVDTAMTDEDKAWVEDQINKDDWLPRLADAFNRQVARTFDEDNGAWDTHGDYHGGRPLHVGLTGSISYKGLDRTVDSSIKLMSLYNDVKGVELRPMWKEENRHRWTSHFVQDYIQGDISTYVRRPDGRIELEHERGKARCEELFM